MAKRFLVFLIVFAQMTAQADIAIRAPGLDSTSFKGIVAARNDLRSLSETGFSSVELAQAKSILNSHLEKAQKSYLAGSLSVAEADFAVIADMAHAADWPAAQRRAILYSFLRSAQLAKNEESQNSFLAKAAAFASDMVADRSLFPPPLILRFETVRKELAGRSLAIRIKDQFEGFESVKINGVAYRTNETDSISLLPGTHRVSLQSEVYLPITEVMTASQLMVYRPPQEPAASGSCDRPAVKKSLGNTAVTVVYATDCLQRFSGGIWQRLPNDLQPEMTDSSLKPLPYLRAEALLSDFDKPRQPIYKKRWFWASVVGALTASAVVIAKRKESQNPPAQEVVPTHREGF